MRLAGAEYPDIAPALGYNSPSAAFRAVEAWQRKIYREDAAETKAINLGRLNRLLQTLWPLVIGTLEGRNADGSIKPAVPPDLQAIEKAIKAIAEINRMMGLYEPIKIDMAFVRANAERWAEHFGLTAEEVISEAEEAMSLSLPPGR
jgi:hypothetical protein